jgi:transcriptional regulator with XRE-family HTH domain
LKERAEELGLSQRQVAQRAEIDPSFLTRIISGERNPPSDDVIERIARALEMPTLDLFLEAGRIPKLKEGVKRALPAFIDAAGELSEDQIRTVFATLDFIRNKGQTKQ